MFDQSSHLANTIALGSLKKKRQTIKGSLKIKNKLWGKSPRTQRSGDNPNLSLNADDPPEQSPPKSKQPSTERSALPAIGEQKEGGGLTNLNLHQNNNSIQAIDTVDQPVEGGLNSNTSAKNIESSNPYFLNSKKKRKKVWIPASSFRNLGII